ncbi:TPA: bacterial Ig-like domain-containing protein, partial [Enterococcus faecalis]
MDYMLSGCSGLTSLDLSSFNIPNVTNMDYMLSACSGLTSVDFTDFNAPNVTNIQGLFSGCIGLTSLDLSSFNIPNVTTMDYLCQACRSATSIVLPHINTSKVTSMDYIVYECISLTDFDVSGLGDITGILGADHLFYTGITETDTTSITHLKLGSTTKLTVMPVVSIDTGNAWRLNNSGEGYGNAELLQSYDGTAMAGDWYWVFAPTLTLQDLTLYTSDSWHPADNFVSATDTTKTKNAVPFEQVVTNGTVDIHTPGSYTITYSYGNLSKEATITVLKDQSAVELKNSQINLYSDETWNPITNFVSAKNKAGDVVPFDQVTVNGPVDTTIPGVYSVTYSSGSVSETVEVTVLQNISYALQLPARLHFSKTNEPKVGQTKGTDTNYNIKLFNTADGQAYSGNSNIQLTVTSQNHWQLQGADHTLGANYKLKDVNGQDITTAVDYSFNLDKTVNEKTLVAYLTSKADKAGIYSDVVTFNYQRVP